MKRVLRTVSVAGLIIAAMLSFAQGSKRNLVISTWGLGEDTLWQDVYTPFEKAYNCKIVLEEGTTAERYTKLAANPASGVDVIELSQKAAADGYAAKLFAKIDYSKIANAKLLIPAAKALTASGFGPAYVINSVGIVYDPSAVKFEIKDWSDLWRPELKGKISIPSLQSTFGPAMVYIAADYAKVPVAKDKGAAAFKALAALKPNILKTYDKSSDLANMFSSGEIAVAVIGDFGLPIVQKAVPDAKYLLPASGSYANFNTVDIVAGSKNQDLAYAYINWRISRELQQKTAVDLNEAPINSSVELSPAQAANKTYGEKAKLAKPIDYTLVNPLMAGWTDLWNRTLND